MDIHDRFTVDITAEDISNGVAIDCFRCPLALALHRRFGGEWEVNDEGASGDWDTDKNVYVRHNGEAFVKAFDDMKPVEPCTVYFERVSV